MTDVTDDGGPFIDMMELANRIRRLPISPSIDALTAKALHEEWHQFGPR